MAGLITPASLKASLRDAMTAEPGTRVLSADEPAIEAAARCLKAGGLIAFPTETVYGLGADAGNGEAIARLYAAKGRPAFNPLIAHFADAEAARRRHFYRSRKKAGRRVLARAAHARACQAAGLPHCRSRAGRARLCRAACACASGCTHTACRLRRANRCALGQPVRPRLADKCC